MRCGAEETEGGSASARVSGRRQMVLGCSVLVAGEGWWAVLGSVQPYATLTFAREAVLDTLAGASDKEVKQPCGQLP